MVRSPNQVLTSLKSTSKPPRISSFVTLPKIFVWVDFPRHFQWFVAQIQYSYP